MTQLPSDPSAALRALALLFDEFLTMEIVSTQRRQWINLAAECRRVAEEADKHAWQPIESAPMDGRHVLALLDGGWMHMVYFDQVLNRWCDTYGSHVIKEKITHWMPMPIPPGGEAAAQKTEQPKCEECAHSELVCGKDDGYPVRFVRDTDGSCGPEGRNFVRVNQHLADLRE